MSCQGNQRLDVGLQCQSCQLMYLIGTGTAATVQSIIMLLKHDMMYDMMGAPKRNYASSTAKRKEKN